MRTFRLAGLDDQLFVELFHLGDAELRARNINRVTANADFGFPCRVSLEDAQTGEELLLLPFEHQSAASPYRASGPIYVRRDARQKQLLPGVVPPYITRRQISLRAYDANHLMIAAEVVDGGAVADRLTALFADDAIQYVHLHNARPGCFSCTAWPV